MGRSDDMLIVKGVNVFPSQIETVLLEQGYPANYQIHRGPRQQHAIPWRLWWR